MEKTNLHVWYSVPKYSKGTSYKLTANILIGSDKLVSVSIGNCERGNSVYSHHLFSI